MSKKIAAASILCLVFGGVSIPGGIFANTFIVDLTYSSMDDGLLGIKDEAIPLITPMVKEFGVAEALDKILGVGGPAVEAIVKEIGPAMVLKIIKEIGGPAVENIVKEIGPAVVLEIIKDIGGPAVQDIVKQIGPAMVLKIIKEVGGPAVENIVKEIGPAMVLSIIKEVGGPAVQNIVKQIGPAMVLKIIKEIGGPAVENIVKEIGPSIVLTIIKEIGGPAVQNIVKQIGPAMVLKIIKEIGQPAVVDIVKKIGPAIVLKIIKEIGQPAIVDIIKQLGPAIALPLIKDNAMPIVEEIVKGTFSSYMMDLLVTGLNVKTRADGRPVDVYKDRADWNNLFNNKDFQWTIRFRVGDIPILGNIKGDVLTFRGISQYFGTSLGFSSTARSRLLWGQDLWLSGVDGKNELHNSPFNDCNKVLGAPTVKKIFLRSGSRIDQVGFTLSNGVILKHGGNGGGYHELVLRSGEYVKKVQLKTGNEIDRIKFTTSHGRILEHGGGGGDWRTVREAPNGWQIIGFYGNADNIVDELGFIYAPIVSNPGSWVPPAYGLAADTASGSGVTKFLELYDKAVSNSATRTKMQNMYSCNWNQLGKIKTYIRNYLQNTMIPIIIDGVDVHVYALWGIVDQWHHVDVLGELMPELKGSKSIAEIAERIFAELWSEGTALGNVIFEGGLDFGEMLDGIPLGATGFEAGLDVNGNLRPLSLSTSKVNNLWNEDNGNAIANMDGIKKWYSAQTNTGVRNSLKSAFGLSDTQMNRILDWLWSPGRFSDYLLPILLESDLSPYNMPIEDLALYILYDQWANLKALDMDIYPNGLDFSEIIDGIDEELKGFEAGLKGNGDRAPLNIAPENVEKLWDESNLLALTHMDGILIWYGAYTSSDDRDRLLGAFPFLNPTQLYAILDWLWAPGRFSDGMLPKLVQAPEPIGYGVTLEELAMEILYDQWANLQVMDMELYPNGLDFSELIDGIDESIIGFEAGLDGNGGSIPLNLAVEDVEKLWDENDPLALTHLDGILVWYAANASSEDRNILLSAFPFLTGRELDAILDWLWAPGRFSDGMLPELIEADEPIGYGMSLEQLALEILYDQWANLKVMEMDLYPDGLDFSELIDGIDESIIGFEAGLDGNGAPAPLNLAIEDVEKLWDEENPLALTNMDGISVWYAAKDYQISMYSEADYQGNSIPLSVGDYPNINEVGMGNDALSSLNVPDVLRVILYTDPNFGGVSWTLDDDISDLYNFGVSSIKVMLKNESGVNPRATLKLEFNLDEVQMNKILDWLWAPGRFATGMLPELVQAPEPIGYGATLEELAMQILYDQWANIKVLDMDLYPEGLDFSSIIDGIDESIIGFEAGLDGNYESAPLNLAVEDVEKLWDEENPLALTHLDGILVWHAANSSSEDRDILLDEFNFLSIAQLDAILDWLWAPGRFSDGMLPELVKADEPIGYGVSLEELALEILYDQWANLKVLEMDLYPEGLDFSSIIDGINESIIGFEVGIDGNSDPAPLNLAVEDVEKLWDEENPLALTNLDGILVWRGANSSSEDYNTLLDEFDFLSTTQMDAILDWLWAPGRFADGMLPELVQAPEPIGYGVTLEELAMVILYDQWANLEVMGLNLYPEGLDFSNIIDGIDESIIGFEAGLDGNYQSTPLNLAVEDVEKLWNEENPLALTHMDGILVWFAANSSSEDCDKLLDEFNFLSIAQMDAILDWLWAPGRFADGMLPQLVQAPEPVGYGVTLEELALEILYDQWANLKVMEMDLYPDGLDFSELIDGIDDSIIGFEVGLDGNGASAPLNLAVEDVEKLWNEENSLALTNMDGILVWRSANSSSEDHNTLLDEFDFLSIAQMDAILDWLWAPGRFADGMLPELIQAPKPIGYGVTLEELAMVILYDQWANLKVMEMDLYPDGLDFSELIDGIDDSIIGFEVGLDGNGASAPLNLAVEDVEKLWDEENPLALTHMDGIMVWHGAYASETNIDKTSLLTQFSFLTVQQLDAILDWLWAPGRFADGMLPELIQAPKPIGYGVTIDKLAIQILYEQWANGTVLGMDMYSDGIDFNELLGGFDGSVIGFEVGVPEPTGISLEQCKALWNSENPKSLLNMMAGIPIWKEAKSNRATRQTLINEFDLTEKQLNQILDWLWLPGGFSEYIVPILIESDYGFGLPMKDFCFHLFLEQWANGTVFGEIMFDNGFPLPLGDVEIFGLEVGVPNPSRISIDSALDLWDKKSEFSLVSKMGKKKWFTAVDGDTEMITTLKTENALDDHAMNALLSWIPDFQQNVMPFLAMYQYDLPMDTVTLGGLLQSTTTLIGGACIGLAVLGITGNVVTKRRRVKKLKIDDKIDSLVKKPSFIKGVEDENDIDSDLSGDKQDIVLDLSEDKNDVDPDIAEISEESLNIEQQEDTTNNL